MTDQTSDKNPSHLESLSDAGAPPLYPVPGSDLRDYGPLADAPSGGTPEEQVEEITEGASLSPMQASLRRFARDKRAMISLGYIVVLVLVCFIFPPIYLHIGGPQPSSLGIGTIGPEVYHLYTHNELGYSDLPSQGIMYPLGTDQLGRDIFARLMEGVKVSIEVGLLVEVFDVILGLLIGTLAGYFGGWIDTALARFTDVMFTFPGLLFAILAAATVGVAIGDRFGPTGRLIMVSLALGITIWPQMARFVRGQTLQVKEQQFVEAARSLGGTNRTIILSHIVPNLFSIVVAAASINIVGTIVGEAVISLLGLGVTIPGSSLGLMIGNAVKQIQIAPLEVVWPCLVLVSLVIALSFIGDGVSDAFNPRSKD